MKRFLLALVILAVGLLANGALADLENGKPDGGVQTVGHGPGGGPKRTISSQAVVELSPVWMPQTTDSVGGSNDSVVSMAGPVSAMPVAKPDFGASNSLEGMLAPRGGTMFTPQQRAEREINRLIRRLD